MIEILLPGLSGIQNIHPMFVHFPITFFLGALAMELVAILVHERFHFAATWMLYLAALSAVLTVATGIPRHGSDCDSFRGPGSSWH